VFYAGSNDLNAGKTAQTVVDDFKTLLGKVEAKLPETTVAFISVNASPSRWKDLAKVKDVNEQVASLAAHDKKLMFINTYTAMLDSEGKARLELYLKDRLHPSARGYAIWTTIIAPFLDRAE